MKHLPLSLFVLTSFLLASCIELCAQSEQMQRIEQPDVKVVKLAPVALQPYDASRKNQQRVAVQSAGTPQEGDVRIITHKAQLTPIGPGYKTAKGKIVKGKSVSPSNSETTIRTVSAPLRPYDQKKSGKATKQIVKQP